jgi:lipoprotein-anchoring transpeptidase ErfK/SrfK
MTRGLRIVPLLLAVAIAGASCGAHRRVTLPPSAPTTQAPPPVAATTTTTTRPPPPQVTTVAALKASTLGHLSPGGPAAGTVPATWYGYKSILPVVARRAGWVEVRLAQRPNQSTTWLPVSAVSLSTTPWRLVLSLATAHLQVFDGNRLAADFPAGIGTTTDPTVTGHYFVAMKVPPPGPGYGAFVLATSAHSNAITDWDSSGDALIGIHGPIDPYDDSLIGTTGARVSHGCIRLHVADLARLTGVLPGSPLDIIG